MKDPIYLYQAPKRIFDRYAKQLCLYALNYLSEEADAEDVVQDVFIRFLQKEYMFTANEKVIKTYLFNSVRNACFDKLEKRDLFCYHIDILKQEIIEEESVAFDEKILSEVKKELDIMPPRTRKIITCVFMQNMKYQEVADELDISINTVKTLLRNGIERLRNRFSKRMEFLLFYLKKISVEE